LLADDKVKAAILASMDEVGRKGGLVGYEIPKAIFLSSEPFSIENGLLTPTMKAKRAVVRARYKAQFDAMTAATRITLKDS